MEEPGAISTTCSPGTFRRHAKNGLSRHLSHARALILADGASDAFVTRLTEEELEALPGVDEGFWD